LSKMGAVEPRKRGIMNETGDSRERKGDATRVVGRANGEAVSEGPKEVAKENKTAHMLHMQDRERTWRATDDGALTGALGLSKAGAVGPRKRRCDVVMKGRNKRRWKGMGGVG
jgi:hypothetical protein